jgi:hypothetical protein
MVIHDFLPASRRTGSLKKLAWKLSIPGQKVKPGIPEK